MGFPTERDCKAQGLEGAGAKARSRSQEHGRKTKRARPGGRDQEVKSLDVDVGTSRARVLCPCVAAGSRARVLCAVVVRDYRHLPRARPQSQVEVSKSSTPSADREMTAVTPRARIREHECRTKRAGPGSQNQEVKRTTPRRDMGSGRTCTCTRTCTSTCATASPCHKYLQDRKYLPRG